MSAFRVVHLDHLVLRTAQMETMIAFYRDVLGCAVERRQDALGLVHLRAGGSFVDLVDVDGELGRRGGPAAGEGARNLDHLCLRIDPWDEEALRRHLAAHGVEAGESGRRFGADGYGRSIYIRDPDGNGVELKGPPEG